MSQYEHFVNGNVVIIATAAFVVLSLYRVYCRPIARIPGPWYSNWTELVQRYHWIKGLSPNYILSLHDKYGPVVRVSPTEVAISDIKDVKAVYSVKETFLKDPFYRRLASTPSDNIFNTSNIELHRKYRRLLAGPMSESSLKPSIDSIHDRVRTVIDKMEAELRTRGAIDVLKWWVFLATDTIGDLTFGSSFNMVEYGKTNEYYETLQSINKLGGLRLGFPEIVAIAQHLPIRTFQFVRSNSERIRKYAVQSLERQRDDILSGSEKANRTLFSKVLRANEEETLSFEEVVANSQSYIIAGSDTTSNTLTFLTWAVATRPAIRDRLIKELQTLPDNFTESHVRELKYLDNVINETLRLHSAAPSTLPRAVPQGGAQIGGYFLAEGTTIGTQAYTMHRNPDTFPNPKEFNPERWENATKEMKDAMMPFGRGSRNCIGMHLALIEIRLGAAMFFRKFTNAHASTIEGMSDTDMIPMTYFLHSPSGKRCLLGN